MSLNRLARKARRDRVEETSGVTRSKGLVVVHADFGAGWLACQSWARSALIRTVAACLRMRRQAFGGSEGSAWQAR
jgi:hypothetical protein